MNSKYYIESLTYDEDNGMYTAKISCDKHAECIEVHGDQYECTDRALKIIKGLNG
jgi:hypothetical protein